MFRVPRPIGDGMLTIEIANPIEARRCRYAQYRCQKARLMLNGLPVTGMVCAVKEDRSDTPTRWMVTVSTESYLRNHEGRPLGSRLSLGLNFCKKVQGSTKKAERLWLSLGLHRGQGAESRAAISSYVLTTTAAVKLLAAAPQDHQRAPLVHARAGRVND